MKVWLVLTHKGNVVGVFLDHQLALKEKKSTEVIEEWEPMLTYNACQIIKVLAQELS